MYKNSLIFVKNIILPCFIVLLALPVIINGSEICDFVFDKCPEDLKDTVIHVSPTTISINSRILTCSIEKEVQQVTDAPPSIVFVIDNSTSMSGNTGNDPQGSRFEVTRDLLDSLAAKFPGAEVGLVVFKNVLYFDKKNLDLAQQLQNVTTPDSQYITQAYIPLLTLDQPCTANGKTQTGLEFLRSILQSETNNNTTNLVYKPEFDQTSGTNINNAFLAAQQALANAKNEKERQFVIFLSDGEASPTTGRDVEAQHGGRAPNWYMGGTNMPTTFTVYLSRTERTPPQNLQTMTTNIKNNGYSTYNTNSNIWLINTNYETLMNLLMTKVIKPILNQYQGSPISMIFNGIASSTKTDSIFEYYQNFPLDEDTTEVSMVVSYKVENKKTGETSDTTATYHYKFVRDEKVKTPSLGSVICYDRNLELHYNGSPVTAVNEQMNELEIVFTVKGGDLYKNVPIIVQNADKNHFDQFTTLLANNNNVWTKKFQRVIADPVLSDSKLEHQSTDSIVIIFRNPDIPLDTIRKSYPFSISKIITLKSAYYLDNNADGYVDSMFISVDGAIIDKDLEDISRNMILPIYRGIQVQKISLSDGGIGLSVKDGAGSPRTYVTEDDVITVNGSLLTNGGQLNSSKVAIQDKMAPVIIESKLIYTGKKDSVQVTFSEPVTTFNSTTPFLFAKPDNKMYSVNLIAGGLLNEKVYTGEISSVENNYIISIGDSIWINPPASISDKLGNEQKNPQNRRVLIAVTEIPYNIVHKVINNPFSPNDKIPDPVKEAYERNNKSLPENGLVIVIEPQDEMRYKIILKGSVSIYDVVKNPIVVDLPMVFDEKLQKLYLVWDGKNSKGRKVATGTYQAVIEYYDNQNNKDHSIKDMVRIGIKR